MRCFRKVARRFARPRSLPGRAGGWDRGAGATGGGGGPRPCAPLGAAVGGGGVIRPAENVGAYGGVMPWREREVVSMAAGDMTNKGSVRSLYSAEVTAE